jgi:pimeloyl-ACP methyl ester carboxylesterase/DNA-binding CsgD family transcriptional regulator
VAAVEQSVQFSSIAGRRVAWAAVGSGPPLVLGGWWMSHLELDWRNPAFRSFIASLAAHRTVIRYDPPGTGLSDRDVPPPDALDDEMEVLAGVIDAAGVHRVAVFGGSSGGPAGVVYAAGHPERVERLILYGAYATGRDIAPPPVRDSMVSLVRVHWGLGSRVLADVFMPDADADERAAFAAFQRHAAPADVAARCLEAIYRFDVADAADRVTAPTLVLHRHDDTAIPFASGRDLAARIRDATFLPLSGREHFPWRGQVDDVLRPTLKFLGVPHDDIDPTHDRPTAPVAVPGETRLSRRELEVLQLVARGLSDTEIAETLYVSAHTVHRHIANIRTKLQVPSRAAAAALAARKNLI